MSTVSKQLSFIFDLLLDLDDNTRFDEEVSEYIKVIETNNTDYSAILTCNREGEKLIRKKLGDLGVSFTLIETTWFPEDKVGNFKLLDLLT